MPVICWPLFLLERMNMKKININDMVQVKLTERGIRHMKENDSVMAEFHFDKNTKTVRTELWQLMNTFGDTMYMGAEQMFENNVVEIIE
jgi:hypothetical protein